MDPQDHLRALLDGVSCTVCDDPVPPDRVRLLAWRDDLAFIQIDCLSCRSASLGFVVAGASVTDGASPSDAAPITADDVLDMHAFLEGWNGNIATVLDAQAGRAPREPGAPIRQPSRRGADPRP